MCTPAVQSERVLSGASCQLSCLPRTSPGHVERQPVQAGETAAPHRAPWVVARNIENKWCRWVQTVAVLCLFIYIVHYNYLKLPLSNSNCKEKNFFAVRFDCPSHRVLSMLCAENQNFTHWPCNLLCFTHIHSQNVKQLSQKTYTDTSEFLSWVVCFPGPPHTGGLTTSSVVTARLARSFLLSRRLARP